MSSTNSPTPKTRYPRSRAAAGKPTPRKRRPARQVADLLPGVLADVVARRSGMTLDLIAAWEEIAGPDFAACTRPEKIRWPRRASELDAFEPATLILACDGAKAIFLQHESGELLARLNLFFGFEAIARLKIVQKPVRPPHRPQPPRVDLTAAEEKRLGDKLRAIADPELRHRLEKFGRGVIARQRGE